MLTFHSMSTRRLYSITDSFQIKRASDFIGEKGNNPLPVPEEKLSKSDQNIKQQLLTVSNKIIAFIDPHGIKYIWRKSSTTHQKQFIQRPTKDKLANAKIRPPT